MADIGVTNNIDHRHYTSIDLLYVQGLLCHNIQTARRAINAHNDVSLQTDESETPISIQSITSAVRQRTK